MERKGFYFAFQPRIGKEFHDETTGATYRLDKVIGTSSRYNCVYRAEYFPKDESGKGKASASTEFVTLKYVQELEDDAEYFTRTRRPRIESTKLIDLQGWIEYSEISLTGLILVSKYMSEGSLRYLLNKRFKSGLPEDCIAIALREALLGLKDLHEYGIHRSFNAGDIFIHHNLDNTSMGSITIKLAIRGSRYDSDLDYYLPPIEKTANASDTIFCVSPMVVAPPQVPQWFGPKETVDTKSSGKIVVKDRFTTKSDIWLVGLTALELAYGDIAVSNRDELWRMIKEIKNSKKLPDGVEDLLVKKGKLKKVTSFIKNKMKSVKGGRFSSEFTEVVLKCLKIKESRRPTVDELLRFPFFEKAKDLNYFRDTVLHGPVSTSNDDLETSLLKEKYNCDA